MYIESCTGVNVKYTWTAIDGIITPCLAMTTEETSILTQNVSFKNEETSFSYTDVDWVVPSTINAFLILVSCWITFSLIHYGLRTGKWSYNACTKSQQLSAGGIYTTVVLCAGMTILRYLTSLATFHLGLGANKNHECEVISDMSFAMYCLVTATVYLFLWMRQRTFYANKMMNVSYNRCVRFVSASSFGVIFVAGLGAIVVSCLPVSYPSSPRGCTYTANSSTEETAGWIACLALLVISQIVLVALFIYPLLRHRNMQRLSIESNNSYESDKSENYTKSVVTVGERCEQFSTSEVQEQNENNSRPAQQNPPRRPYSMKLQRKILKIMLRTIIFGILSIASDIWWLMFSTYILSSAGPRRWSTTAYDLNVMFNLCSVVCSFLDFPMMLTSPLRKRLTTNNPITSD